MTNSEQWFQRAQKVIPGGVNSPVRSFGHVGRAPVYFEKAQGPYLFDVEGNRYIDFCLAFGPHLLGHSPAPVVQAIQAQAEKATTFGACHPGEVELAEWVLRAYPFLDRVRLVNSGTEAVMTAVRLARGSTGRSKVVQFDGCYHGHSDGLLACAGSGVAALSEASSKGVPASIVAQTLVARMDDLPALESLFEREGRDIAAVLLEPVPANNGLWVPSRQHVRAIVDLARRHGALVVFDEVINGFRLGLSGGSGFFGLEPDLVTLGKVLGGGLPTAAVAGTAAVMDGLAPLGGVYQAGTLSGNPMATAAGCAVMEVLFGEPPYEALEQRTEAFAAELETRLAGKLSVRRVASLFWIHFGDVGQAFPPAIGPESRERYGVFFRRCLEAGVYLPPSPFEVGFVSAAHTESVLREALEKMVVCVE